MEARRVARADRLSRATSLAASPGGMLATLLLSACWAIVVGTLAGALDAVISGGSLLFGQAIYREKDRWFNQGAKEAASPTGGER